MLCCVFNERGVLSIFYQCSISNSSKKCVDRSSVPKPVGSEQHKTVAPSLDIDQGPLRIPRISTTLEQVFRYTTHTQTNPRGTHPFLLSITVMDILLRQRTVIRRQVQMILP